ncbi:glycosyl transferase [Clostridia bacterium]|nr:glycosyl transferase [Clostridia bacterium]
MVKRFFDIAASFLGLVILSPVFIILSLLIVFESKGGVFFRGVRVGKNGKAFRIFKFRSMYADSEGNGKWNVGNNDSRITRIGHFLRNTKLDELPQLINVFIGNMSFVGPRPELQYYVDMYTENEAEILNIKPGITDWASLANISQYTIFTSAADPDEIYLNEIRPIKLRLQMYYYENKSLMEDFKILFLTVFKVATRSKYIPERVNTAALGWSLPEEEVEVLERVST